MREEESDPGEVFGKASSGETFAWKVEAGRGDSGATFFWAVFTAKSPPDDFPFSRLLDLDILGTFPTREEALLFAESLGLDPKVVPFDPDYSELMATGRIVPFPRERR